jgi:mycothiol synthase
MGHLLLMDFAFRPASLSDAPLIFELIATSERELEDQVIITESRVLADLTREAIDLSTDTLLAFAPNGTLAGWAWVHGGRRAEVDVHPSYRGHGLGSRLVGYAETRARELGSDRLGQNVADSDTAAAAILLRRGYAPLATSWQLTIDLSAPPVIPPAPPGITVRPFAPGDEQATYTVVETAFRDWQKRHNSYEAWAHLTIERPDFAPAFSPLAFDGSRLVGAALSLDQSPTSGYITNLAVSHTHRNRGLARLLLTHAFATFHAANRRSCTLWTHSDTGALALYERVGMTVHTSGTHYSKPL